MPKLLLPSLFLAAMTVIVLVFAPANNNQDELKILEEFIVDEQQLPEFELISITKQKLSLRDYAKDASLITVWSPNCNECLEALRTQQQFALANNIKINTIALSPTVESVQEYMAQNEITLPVAVDTEARIINYWGSASPTTVFVNSERVLMIFPGRISYDHLAAILTLTQ